MSQTFSLVCHETKKKIWVGQGGPVMSSFYSGHPGTMDALHSFLSDHLNKPLFLLCDDTHDEITGYESYDEPKLTSPP